MTTHPAVFGSVIRNLRDKGFDRVSYGDSPGHPGGPEKTSEICGLKEVADRLGISMADFTHSKTVEFVRGRISRKFEICQGVLDSDAIINLCKMKTHQLERITGGVKNMFGCVYGMNKGAAHAKYPDGRKLCSDAGRSESAAESKTPHHGRYRSHGREWSGVGHSGEDECDPGFRRSRCTGRDLLQAGGPGSFHNTPPYFYGAIFGLGRWKEGDIEILGVDDLSDYCNPHFDVMRDKNHGGKWAYLDKLKFLARKPVILKDKCVRCGACVAACPLEDKAVFFPEKAGNETDKNAGKNVPVYDYKKCIRCYCCQEMCPEKAIIVKRKLI